jgi:undecaprenyl diphosphate synthase
MKHLAIIMDGNGRWAAAHRRPRLMGHRAGADALDRVMHYCRESGIKYLTVYAFSTENWKRSEEEVSGLMKLLSHVITTKAGELVEKSVRFRVIGRIGDLPKKLQQEIADLEKKTEKGEFTLSVALSYGGRAEIVDAAKKFLAYTSESGAKIPEGVELENLFSSFMYAPDIPDPDLIIRTSGECRTSNFLLWESAYSEYYFTDVLWPDFDKAEFDKALSSYSRRERRMGGRFK